VLELIPPDAQRVGLVGAAVTDHPKIVELVRTLVDDGRSVGISSLRADRLCARPELVSLLARSGAKTLTTAADGASERLRKALDRKTNAAQLIKTAELAREAGFARLKLYLMLGLPGEEDRDLDELVLLAAELSRIIPTSFGCAPFVAKRNTPMDGAPFARVLDVARWVRDELEELGVAAYPKTSGASGLHVYLPLPSRTPYKAGMLFCQIVGELVAKKHPKEATVERIVNRRDPTQVYVDCLQNIEGKTLACAYSARASAYGGASTPLLWAEVDAGIDPTDFTMRTLPARVRQVGDLWEALRTSKGVDLAAALERVHARHGR